MSLSRSISLSCFVNICCVTSPNDLRRAPNRIVFCDKCGESSNQPFYDGSHSKTNFNNVAFTAEKTGKVYLCGCKQTSNRPFCDGSHMNI